MPESAGLVISMTSVVSLPGVMWVRSVTRSAVMGVRADVGHDRRAKNSSETILMELSGCMGSVPIF